MIQANEAIYVKKKNKEIQNKDPIKTFRMDSTFEEARPRRLRKKNTTFYALLWSYYKTNMQ